MGGEEARTRKVPLPPKIQWDQEPNRRLPGARQPLCSQPPRATAAATSRLKLLLWFLLLLPLFLFSISIPFFLFF